MNADRITAFWSICSGMQLRQRDFLVVGIVDVGLDCN